MFPLKPYFDSSVARSQGLLQRIEIADCGLQLPPHLRVSGSITLRMLEQDLAVPLSPAARLEQSASLPASLIFTLRGDESKVYSIQEPIGFLFKNAGLYGR